MPSSARAAVAANAKSTQMPFDRDKAYNDLPLLPPNAKLETKAVLRKAIAANKVFAELKGAGELIRSSWNLLRRQEK